MSSTYELPGDPDSDNDAHSLTLSMVGYNKSVLEVGCPTGFTKTLVERGCNVVGIEIDRDAARVAEEGADGVIVGTLDDAGVWGEVKDESFDVVVLGEVLEHLRDPLGSLRQAVRKVKPSGFVVTSVLNVAHGDLRVALLKGEFHYNDSGLLDQTHLRFFTLETIRELLTQASLAVVETRRVIVPLFHTELGVRRQDVSDATLDALTVDPEAEVYQYVMKAVVDNGTQMVAGLPERLNALTDYAHNENVRTALLRKELHDQEFQIAEPLRRRVEEQELITQEQQRIIREQQDYVEALEGHISGLEHNIDQLHSELAASDARFRSLQETRQSDSRTSASRWLSGRTVRQARNEP